MRNEKGKVFVGMSGGVDSSVSAQLLKNEGYDVVGVFIKVWQADFLPCTWREERREAMRAAAHIGIPIITLDLEKEYKDEVVNYMIREYGKGNVPNPDVMCNKFVKFGAFLDFAKKNGAQHVATGHYSRVKYCKENSSYKLLMGLDEEKDQSYFLWTLTQVQLQYILFPVGNLQKREVRKLAKDFNLPNAEKKDSQGLCFMGAIDMAEFLKHYLKTTTGDVLDLAGKVIGTHQGALLYTIGQRHGFHTAKQSANESPLFVVAKDISKNTITVGIRSNDMKATEVPYVQLEEINIINIKSLTTSPILCDARMRYRGPRHGVRLTMGSHGKGEITFEHKSELAARGQSVVLYDKDECIGGGVIA